MKKTTVTSLLYLILVSQFCQYLISYRLWLADIRQIPAMSAFQSLEIAYPYYVQAFLFIASLASLLGAIFFRYRQEETHFRKALIAYLLITSLQVLHDVACLQPWLYSHCLFFIFYLLYSQESEVFHLQSFRAILGGTYLWSGIQKLNAFFAQTSLKSLTAGLGVYPFFEANPWLAHSLGIIEALIGIGMLWHFTRKWASWLGIGMHAFILFSLLMRGDNFAVVPWNLAWGLAIFLINVKEHDEKSPSFVKKHYPLLFLVIVLPALSFVDKIDNYLSSALYAGRQTQLVLYFPASETQNLPATAQKYIKFAGEGDVNSLSLNVWFLGETQAANYAEPRYLLRMGEKLCEHFRNKEMTAYVMFTYPRWEKAYHKETYYCNGTKE
ncbi:MAG: MauE/DoxX family redox-associated membrane protein [Bacteroidia bacterium]